MVMMGTMVAQGLQMLPADPEVKVGKLDNGMTYYLRHNNWPEGRISFFLSQKVGSNQEEDTQLGLAHFLEHMCFNGSEHFKGNASWDFLQRNGIDFNAFTSFDHTLYFLNNVPTTVGQTNLDSCMLVLYDWAHALTLDSTEINKERDVIHGEYRMGQQGAQKLMLDALPSVYPGRYGQRSPIGKMEIVDNFKHKELVDYYHKWYNPENQALIIIGDIDVDAYEKQIKEMFSPLKSNPGSGKVEIYGVEPTDKVTYNLAKDKDMQVTQMRYGVVLPPVPDEARGSVQYRYMSFATEVAMAALKYRIEEITPKPECPWLQAVAMTGSMVSTRIDQINLIGIPKEGKDLETYALMLTELRRLEMYGVTESEYERFKTEYNTQLDDLLAQKDKIESSSMARSIADHFAYGSDMMSVEQEVQVNKTLIQQMPVQVINQIIPTFGLVSGKNTSMCCWSKDIPGATYPTEEQLTKVWDEVMKADIEPLAEAAAIEPLMSTLPAAGKIVSEKDVQFGYRELTLSNGMKVCIRKTDIEPNQVTLSAVAKGGHSIYNNEEDWINAQFATQLPYTYGGHNSRQLMKILAGKKADSSFGMSFQRRSFSGSAGSKDVETMLQLIYLGQTALGKDEEMYPNIMAQLETILANRKSSENDIYNDSLSSVLNCHDKRFRSPQVEDLKNMNYDRMLEMSQKAMMNAADFDVIISGDFDEEALRGYICQYLASLPSTGKQTEYTTVVEPCPTKDIVCDFKGKMTEPKVKSTTMWINTKMAINPQNVITARIAASVLSKSHFRILREEMSACYTPGAAASIEMDPVNHSFAIRAYNTGLNQNKADEAIAYTMKSLADLAENCSADDLKKSQEEFINDFNKQKSTSLGFYAGALRNLRQFDYNQVDVFENTVRSLTPESIQAWVKEFMKDMVAVRVTMRPE